MRLRILLVLGCLLQGGCASVQMKPQPVPPPVAQVVAPIPHPAPSPLAPPPLATPFPRSPAATSEKVTFAADAFFDTDQSVLRSDAKAKLDELVRKTSDVSIELIIAVGHADSVGSDAYNQKLSMSRAESVKAYLVSKGIEANRIYAEGKGEAMPVADNMTAEGRAKSRRVELEVVGTRGSSGRPMESRAPKGVVSVLYGTTRAKSGRNSPYTYFTSDESTTADRLTLGRVLVNVPPNRRKATIPEPDFFSVILEKVTSSSVASFLAITPISAANPMSDFSFAGPVEELTPDDFRDRLRSSAALAKGRTAVVYVHGFSNSFKDAAFRTAQVAYDLADSDFQVVPVMFSWPSDPKKLNYVGSGDRLWAAGKYLARFLDEIAKVQDIGRIHIIAHSKGAQVLTYALDEIRVPNLFVDSGRGPPLVSRFKQIVLAAPDIRALDFEFQISPAVRSRHSVTNYVASNDAALRVAKHANSGSRAGDSGEGLCLVSGVETIDVSSVNYRPGGHSSFADSVEVLDDIRRLLKGDKAEQRGLQRVSRQDLGYWLLLPTNK